MNDYVLVEGLEVPRDDADLYFIMHGPKANAALKERFGNPRPHTENHDTQKPQQTVDDAVSSAVGACPAKMPVVVLGVSKDSIESIFIPADSYLNEKYGDRTIITFNVPKDPDTPDLYKAGLIYIDNVIMAEYLVLGKNLQAAGYSPEEIVKELIAFYRINEMREKEGRAPEYNIPNLVLLGGNIISHELRKEFTAATGKTVDVVAHNADSMASFFEGYLAPNQPHKQFSYLPGGRVNVDVSIENTGGLRVFGGCRPAKPENAAVRRAGGF